MLALEKMFFCRRLAVILGRRRGWEMGRGLAQPGRRGRGRIPTRETRGAALAPDKAQLTGRRHRQSKTDSENGSGQRRRKQEFY